MTVTLLVPMILATGAAAQEPAETEEPSPAQPQRSRDWRLRFGLLVADTSGSTSVGVDPGSVDVSVSGGGGGFLSFERKMTPLLGIELGLIGMGSDIGVSTGAGLKHIGTEVDLLAMGSLTLGLNFHFVDEGPVELSVGPLISFNRFADVSIRAGFDHPWWPAKHDGWSSVRTRSDSELSWGAKAGLDIPIDSKRRWSLGGSLTYLDASYDFERESEPGRSAVSLDPLIFSFGAGFRF
jgi:outer membrane protein W